MPLFLGKDGVNRELKEVYLNIDGINKKQKEIYAAQGGVNRKVYSSELRIADMSYSSTTRTVQTLFSNLSKINFYLGYLGAGELGRGTTYFNFDNGNLRFEFSHADREDNVGSNVTIYYKSTQIGSVIFFPHSANFADCTVELNIDTNLFKIYYTKNENPQTLQYSLSSYGITKPLSLTSITLGPTTNGGQLRLANCIIS